MYCSNACPKIFHCSVFQHGALSQGSVLNKSPRRIVRLNVARMFRTRENNRWLGEDGLQISLKRYALSVEIKWRLEHLGEMAPLNLMWNASWTSCTLPTTNLKMFRVQTLVEKGDLGNMEVFFYCKQISLRKCESAKVNSSWQVRGFGESWLVAAYGHYFRRKMREILVKTILGAFSLHLRLASWKHDAL